MDAILDGLNEAQRAAVVHTGGPLLVVAGAGSGKTRVITRRIAWRIRNGLAPSEVLAITFTNKAAAEMRQRVDALVGAGRVWISTFHSLGARLLRMEAESAGLDRNFTIYDVADQTAIMREVLRKLGLQGEKPREFLESISTRKNAGIAPDAESGDLTSRVHAAYEREMAASRAVDFDDLLVKPALLLAENDIVRRRFTGRFRTLLVDEYQDTNRLQYQLVKLLALDHLDVTATGDPDQSIYGWRGAEVRNILEFERDFPSTRVVKLEENYRSTNRFLQAASAVIRHNENRLDRDLFSRLGDGEPIRLIAAPSDFYEARRVIEGIRAAQADGFGLDEIAVFYRTNAISRALEDALRRENLPYVIVGAVEFYERREVKDLLAYLRALVNPWNSVDLLRILNVPLRGIGATSAQRLSDAAEQRGIPLRDLVLDRAEGAKLRGKARDGLAELAAVLDELLAMPRYPVAPILQRAIELTRYREWLKSDDDPLADDRVENVGELVNAVREYDLRHPGGSLEDFLAETALVRSRDAEETGEPRVTLMTLHSAKGLEFKAVFIVGLEEGLLPHSLSLDTGNVEEERRLMYVGLTRAMRRLTLSYARERGRRGAAPTMMLSSRFLDEIPRELMEATGLELDPQPARFEPSDEGGWFEVDEPPFAIGDWVAHARFGLGRVVNYAGFGPSAKVKVDFRSAGLKTLVLEFAQLRRAELVDEGEP